MFLLLGIFRNGPEQLLLLLVQDLHRVDQVDVFRDIKGGFHVIHIHRLPGTPFRVEHCPADEVQADPEVPAGDGPLDDEVEHFGRDHPGVDTLPDPVLEDGLNLPGTIRREVDLARLHHGHHAGIQFP